MQDNIFSTIDVAKIDREARRLRAEVMANTTKNMISWVKARFSARPQGDRQTA